MPDKTKDEHGYTPDNYQPLPNKEAIVHFNGKTLLTAESYLDVKAYEHALAFTVAGLMDEDLLKDVRDAVASAMENGTDFREFKRTLKPYLMAKGWLAETLDDGTQQLVAGSNRRLRTIYSTNLQTAYSAGQWERIQQTKEFLPYLQYMPSVSENPRLSHKRYYGLCRPADDAIWQSIMPPNGWGCKCWVKQLTKRQAQKVGISEEKPLEMEDYKNPKTGEVSKVPVGVDPSFNHNFDRFTALIRLAEDKHGTDFTERLRNKLLSEMLEYAVKEGNVSITDFTGITAVASEVARLEKELDGNLSPFEAEVADQWQQKNDVTLERFDPAIHNVLVKDKSADYVVVEDGKLPKELTTIDFLFTMPKTAADIMDYRIFDSAKKKDIGFWDKVTESIDEHCQKADILPMDMRNLSYRVSTKIIAYVLSLPKEYQQKIVFITGQ